MTQRTVERDQRRTTCDHLAVTEDHLTTDETPHQDKKTADIHRNQFSSWAKVGEDTLDEAAPHHFDRTYSVKTWARLYGWCMHVISGPACTDQTHAYTKLPFTSLLWGSLRLRLAPIIVCLFFQLQLRSLSMIVRIWYVHRFYHLTPLKTTHVSRLTGVII